MVCSTTCPRRWTFAGSRGGRCVALVARSVVTEVEHLRRLARQRGELVGVGDDPHQDPARVGQVHGEPADALRQLLDLRPGGVGEPHHVGRSPRPGRPRRGTSTAARGGRSRRARRRRCPAAAARPPCGCTVVNPNACANRSEAARSGLLELEPGQVEHLDDGVRRASRVLAAAAHPARCAGRCGSRGGWSSAAPR